MDAFVGLRGLWWTVRMLVLAWIGLGTEHGHGRRGKATNIGSMGETDESAWSG